MSRSASATASLKLALGGALALAAAMGIGRFVYTPILPFMAEGVPLSAAEAGLIAAANFLGYLIGALAGSLGNLPGSQRSWFLSALLASALTSAAMGLADTQTFFLALRFLGGFASAFVLVFSSALVLEQLAKAGHPGLSALHFSGVGIGIASSAVLIAVLGACQVSWQALWFASGVATLILLIAIAWLVPRSPVTPADVASPTSEHAVKDQGASASLIRLVIAYGLFGFGYVITATFISVIVREAPELRSAEAYVWLTVGLTAAPSILIWNRISFRLGPKRAFAVACLAEAAGVALSVVATTPLTILLAAALLGGTFMGITALGLIEARRLGTSDPRRVLAVMTASFGLGQMIGPWVAGQLRSVSGDFQAASFAAAGALVIAAGLVAFVREPARSETGPKPTMPDWDSLRGQLVTEGKAELVDAIETLRAEGGNIEAIRRLRENGYLAD